MSSNRLMLEEKILNEKTRQRVEAVYNKVHNANEELFQIWKEDIVFSWQWWFGVGLIIIPWVFWFFYRKRTSTNRLLYSGFMVLIISSWLDFIGITLGLWYYPVKVIPTIPAYLIWDFTLLPISAMVLIQFRPHLHPIFKASIYAGLNAFIGEPVFQWLGFYQPKKWEYIYSFPIFFLIYLFGHFLSIRKNFEPL